MLKARQLLKSHLMQQGMTPTEFSRQVGVNQSTVQRFLTGQIKSPSKTVIRLLKYAGIDWQKCINDQVTDATENTHIRRALAQVWDGADGTARFIANVILGSSQNSENKAR